MTKQKTVIAGTEGFTMVELMIVLAVVSLLAVIIFPRLFKAAGKAYMSDAVGSLAAISSQVESKCVASGGQMPGAANMANFVASYPNGYNTPAYGTAQACTGYEIKYASSNTALPTICISRAANGTFTYGAVAGTSYSTDDVPANTTGGC